MLSLGFLVFVFGAVCGSLEPKPGDAAGRDHCNDRLTHIEGFLSNLIHLQEGRLSRQENLIRHLNAKLAEQEENYNEKLSRQEILISQQQDNYINLLSEFREPRLQLMEGQQVRQGRAAAGRREGTATARHAETRSDDLGPLEAVVTQLSQKVTEIQALQTQSVASINADIQALKASTSADLQALKASTSADVQRLKVSDSRQDQGIRDASTSTFVQWGNSACAANSTLIYSGVVGGSKHGHSGAAANYLCLTLSPVLPSTKLSPWAYLFGGEYETFDEHFDMDPVCAVCRSTFATTVMIPGTNVCTRGWHKQYSGYLMAGGYNHAAASEYICVASELESTRGSSHDDNGKLLYFVQTQCGSLPCTPYVNNRIVTCAVCSK